MSASAAPSALNYGPVTISGWGSNYTIALAQPIDKPDRVTITIGNATVATYTRLLDVLPGDFNDDGVVNGSDVVGVHNEWLRINGAVPTIFGDINGDGVVNGLDYNDVRRQIGTINPTIYVVNSTDGGDSGTGDIGTLPYVIGKADNDPNIAGNEIYFDPSVFGSQQTITLSSTLVLSETAGPEVIDGPGAGLVTVSGGNAVEVFSVASGVTAILTGLTISRGLASQGGALSVDGGTVALTNASIINNQAVGAAGAAGTGGAGGNGASGLGGGIYLAGGSLTLNDDTVANNVARGGAGGNGGGGAAGGGGGLGAGGGIYVADGTVIANDDFFQSNQAIGGAGGNGGAGALGTAGNPNYSGTGAGGAEAKVAMAAMAVPVGRARVAGCFSLREI